MTDTLTDPGPDTDVLAEPATVVQQLAVVAIAGQASADAKAATDKMRALVFARLLRDYRDEGTKSKVISIDGVKLGTATITEPTDKAVVTDEAAFKLWLMENYPAAIVTTVTIDPEISKVLLDPKKGCSLSDTDGGPVFWQADGSEIDGVTVKKAGLPTTFSINGKNVDALRGLASRLDLTALNQQAPAIDATATVAGEVITEEGAA